MKQLNMKQTPHDTSHTCISLLTKADINDNLNMYINDHLRMYTSDYALI